MAAPPHGVTKAKGLEITFFIFLERLFYFCRLPLVDMYLHMFAMVWREIGTGKGVVQNTPANMRESGRGKDVLQTPSENTLEDARSKKYPLLHGNDAKSVCDPRHVNALLT